MIVFPSFLFPGAFTLGMTQGVFYQILKGVCDLPRLPASAPRFQGVLTIFQGQVYFHYLVDGETGAQRVQDHTIMR